MVDPYGSFVGIHYEISKRGTIRNITVYGSMRAIWVSASDDCVVEGNTLIGCKEGIVLHGMPRDGGKYTLKRNRVRANVVFDCSDEDVILFAGEDAEGNASDRNTFFRADRKFIATDTWDGKCYSLEEWRKATGHDVNSTWGRPKKSYPTADEAFVRWMTKNGKAAR